ncbi:MAG: DNA polymerase III subunit chi [Gammaproteobacteria bacterium]|nr:MAG: DNA polymerase III subunit chi [Gammaproteobacteria bacterium]
MTRVDFYILQGEANRDLMACRLCEKAWQRRLGVVLAAADAAHAQRLDELLWTFRDRAFVPHRLIDGPPPEAPVPDIAITWPGAGRQPAELFINLDDAVPEDWTAWPRIAEIVNETPAVREAGRRRFAAYRAQGADLHHHKL